MFSRAPLFAFLTLSPYSEFCLGRKHRCKIVEKARFRELFCSESAIQT